MSPTLRERLLSQSLAGRYDLFLGIGAGLAILGTIFFVQSLLASPASADRAWQVFHVNWIYFTGLSAGGVAFAAVQKVTNSKWSGMIIRFSEALVAFLPVSLIGLVLIFTLGYQSVYGPMQGALHEL
jgi:Ni/Fe-hydrogenase subunit HybB-like protein